MERRTLLFGTGVTAVTTLAGCLSAGDDDFEDEGSDATDDGDSETGDDHDDYVTIPGIDRDHLESVLAEYGIEIVSLSQVDGHVHLTVQTTTRLETELEAADESAHDEWEHVARNHYEEIAASVRQSITDEEALENGVETLRLTVIDDDEKLITDVTVEVARAMQEIDDEDWDDVDWDDVDRDDLDWDELDPDDFEDYYERND